MWVFIPERWCSSIGYLERHFLLKYPLLANTSESDATYVDFQRGVSIDAGSCEVVTTYPVAGMFPSA